jgi:Acyltransferase family
LNKRAVSLGHLRTFITLLVVAHHAAIAYSPYSNFDAAHYLWGAPIVDSVRWQGFALFVHFNDTFFMPLIFFVSGLFVWSSLNHKGERAYLRERVARLGLPFVIAVGLLMPLAFYPSFRMTGTEMSLASFWLQSFSADAWPAGPAWFMWVLLALNCALVVAISIVPRLVGVFNWVGRGTARNPFTFFVSLVALTGVAHLAMLHAFGPTHWFSWGPFAVWASRLPFYVLYFLTAVCIGTFGVERGLLANQGPLAQRWAIWVCVALLSFALLLTIERLQPELGSAQRIFILGCAWGFAFALACASISFAMLALFVRFATGQSAIFRNLQHSAYGIYVIHFIFVVWLQYAILDILLPAIVKASIVFIGAVAFSWGLTALIRRLPVAKRIL